MSATNDRTSAHSSTGGIKVLGIDPGWKNLAFCLFQRTKDSIDILQWELVDLFPETVKKPAAKRKKTGAATAAPKKKRAKTKPLRECNERLQRMLVDKKWEEGVHLISIENQTGGPRGNNTSRCISHCIQSYMLHFADKGTQIDFVHPRTKRNFFAKDVKLGIEQNKNQRERYNLTKNGAKIVVKGFLEGSLAMPYGWPPLRVPDDLRRYFASMKKQDDLSDALLLGLILLRRHELARNPKRSAARGKRKPAAALEATATKR